jgi:ketosteroid isomerase-like protein
MADRDHVAFESFLSDEAVFLSDSKPLRGKQEVAKAWEPFYEGAAAPFSWQPDQVEVLASGTLAISTGPVYNAQGKLVARFSSIWRKDAPGVWRIVFDRGEDICKCRVP